MAGRIHCLGTSLLSHSGLRLSTQNVFLLANTPLPNLFLLASLVNKEKKNIKLNKIKDHLKYNKNPLPQ